MGKSSLGIHLRNGVLLFCGTEQERVPFFRRETKKPEIYEEIIHINDKSNDEKQHL